MIKMNKFVCFIFFAFVLCLSSFAQNTSNGYGSLQWGNSIETVKKFYPNIVEVPVERYSSGNAWQDYVPSEDVAIGIRIFKQELSESDIKNRFFRFFNDKLYHVEVYYNRDVDNRAIISELIRQYGSKINRLENKSVSELIDLFDGTDGQHFVWIKNNTRIVAHNAYYVRWRGGPTFKTAEVFYINEIIENDVEIAKDNYELNKGGRTEL